MNHQIQAMLMSSVLLLSTLGCGKHQNHETTSQPNGDQGASVTAIETLGGKVRYDEKAAGKPPYSVSFEGINFGDSALKAVERLTELKSLGLLNTRVTDAGLEPVERLRQLRVLILANTQVTDAGLQHIKGLVHLDVLDLGDTQVTDAGLKCIMGLANLQTLNLMGTRITDAGLEQLAGLRALRRLSTIGTQVTPAGLRRLKLTLPNLKIWGNWEEGKPEER